MTSRGIKDGTGSPDKKIRFADFVVLTQTGTNRVELLIRWVRRLRVALIKIAAPANAITSYATPTWSEIGKPAIENDVLAKTAARGAA
jgi:hypothetical protein